MATPKLWEINKYLSFSREEKERHSSFTRMLLGSAAAVQFVKDDVELIADPTTHLTRKAQRLQQRLKDVECSHVYSRELAKTEGAVDALIGAVIEAGRTLEKIESSKRIKIKALNTVILRYRTSAENAKIRLAQLEFDNSDLKKDLERNAIYKHQFDRMKLEYTEMQKSYGILEYKLEKSKSDGEILLRKLQEENKWLQEKLAEIAKKKQDTEFSLKQTIAKENQLMQDANFWKEQAYANTMDEIPETLVTTKTQGTQTHERFTRLTVKGPSLVRPRSAQIVRNQEEHECERPAQEDVPQVISKKKRPQTAKFRRDKQSRHLPRPKTAVQRLAAENNSAAAYLAKLQKSISKKKQQVERNKERPISAIPSKSRPISAPLASYYKGKRPQSAFSRSKRPTSASSVNRGSAFIGTGLGLSKRLETLEIVR